MTVCIRPLAPTELLPFLILRQAAGCKQAALARHLLDCGSVSAAARASPWPTLEYHVYAAQRQCVALQTLGLHTVPVYSLPIFLRAARPQPAALFVRGNLELLAQLGLAIVGSRRASHSAVRWARSQALDWAAAGAAAGVQLKGANLIISGGAHGIDTAAHTGALDAGGMTAAYLGAPIDSPYPATNKPHQRTSTLHRDPRLPPRRAQSLHCCPLPDAVGGGGSRPLGHLEHRRLCPPAAPHRVGVAPWRGRAAGRHRQIGPAGARTLCPYATTAAVLACIGAKPGAKAEKQIWGRIAQW
jgi:hypothetical protein